jgi:hypothetical protein
MVTRSAASTRRPLCKLFFQSASMPGYRVNKYRYRPATQAVEAESTSKSNSAFN